MNKKDSIVKIPTLRLSPATTLHAIGNKAKRASAIAAIEKIQQTQHSNIPSKNGKGRKTLPEIEIQFVDVIFKG